MTATPIGTRILISPSLKTLLRSKFAMDSYPQLVHKHISTHNDIIILPW